MILTNLCALLVTTNLVMRSCPYCRPDSTMLAVLHEHQYDQVVTTNYLPIVKIGIDIKKDENKDDKMESNSSTIRKR